MSEDQSSIEFDQLPGCCGVGVLHEAYYNGETEFKKLIIEKIYDVRNDDYGYLIYTHIKGRDELKWMKELGFSKLAHFTSPKTDNIVYILGLNISARKWLNKPKSLKIEEPEVAAV